MGQKECPKSLCPHSQPTLHTIKCLLLPLGVASIILVFLLSLRIMCVNVVFVIRCLYSAVSLTLVKEQCYIRIIYYYYYLCGFNPPTIRPCVIKRWTWNLRRAMISVHAVHMKARQAMIYLHKFDSEEVKNDLSVSHPGVKPGKN